MLRFVTIGLITALLLLLPAVARAGDKIQFNRDVRPILSNRCFTCHGPDSATRQAGLRLDQRPSALGEADSGEHAIVPGDPSASELVRRITADDEFTRMPPTDGPAPLSDDQVATLKAWIEQGAEYQAHWAFLAPRSPEIPAVSHAAWPRNEIDRFVMARLDREGLQPAEVASKESLIRRVAFDLTGLPPTLQEIDQFLADDSPRAYQRMVDRYLESPAYGEHMARHWLDLARYADTNGYQYDTEREQWVWRDWVIDAYNKNKPFDQFTIEQIAGDLLPDATPQQRLATGFNRNHGITIEGGVIDEEYRTEYVMDRLSTTGSVWLGLTVGCARCHDHKFDPLSQKEFYQMYSFFNQVPERGMRGFAPQEKIASPLAQSQRKEVALELARLKEELNQPENVEQRMQAWANQLAKHSKGGWSVLRPESMKSTGGSTLNLLDDNSLLVSGTNPKNDVYQIIARTDATNLTAVRLEALTHESLPGTGPGRHSNSNFVLSEVEVTAVSIADPAQSQAVAFTRAEADYSQVGYEIGKTIDGTTAGNNGWAVDGPSRKQPATAMFIAAEPFGFAGGTELRIRLRHEAGFPTHGIGRPRLSITSQSPENLELNGIPEEILQLAKLPRQQRSEAQYDRLRDYFLAHDSSREELRQRIARLEKQQTAGLPATMIMQDMAKPRQTFILNRGQYNEPTRQVSADVPEVFPPLPTDAKTNRLAFARWLVDPRHPLTSRVAVNRYWQQLFGRGIVKTAEDFGVQGELPSHGELLDWLALEFIRSGWDVKHMHRLIVNSATYRQTSHVSPEAYQLDPENRLLTRGPRLRLSGEEVRDSALAVSGLLVKKLGGKSVYPYQPKGLWLELNNRPGYSVAYERGQGADLYRRSIYTFWKRTVPSPMLKTFDAPTREFCTIRRSSTNTPLQALLLLNGPQFVEAARHLGRRMMTQGGDSTQDRLRHGFRLVTSRRPNEAELKVLTEAYQASLDHFSTDSAAATKLLEVGDSPVDTTLPPAELAAYADVARLLLNMNDAITKG